MHHSEQTMGKMNRFVQQLGMVVLLVALVPSSWACAICAPADGQNTLSHRLFAADIAVLATAARDGAGFRAVEAIKGEPPKGVITLQDGLPAMPALGPNAPQLLLYSAGSKSWRTVGALGTARADWARRLLTLPRASAFGTNAPDAAWPARVAFFVGDLQSPEPLVAQTAYEEISVAPYAVMRTLKPALDAHQLTLWLDMPQLAARRPLYALLLGMVGNDVTAATLEKRLLASSRLPNTAEVSAMLAAYLEIRGNLGVGWVERNYLVDPIRSEPEVQAALLALSVHGNDGARVSRDRVVQAYAGFIRHNKSRAGFVASDLGSWGHWEFGPDYAAILKSGEPQAFASRYAMVFYLMRSPRPEARAALDALRATGVL